MPRKGSISVPKIEYVCDQCGVTFTRWASQQRSRGGVFCSHACHCASRRKADDERGKTGILRRCEHCGGEFYAKSSFVARGDGRFCSRQCHYDHRRIAPRHISETHRECKHCGESFTHSTWQPQTYCSVACANAAKIKPKAECATPVRPDLTKATCPVCSTVFVRRYRHYAKCCSPACATAARNIRSRPRSDTGVARPHRQARASCVCEQCGEAFAAKISRVQSGGARYCSRECLAASQRAIESGQNKRRTAGAEYRRWRRAVFTRDGYRCQHCGQKLVALHAHHIKPWKDFPALRRDVSNGITLCGPCHKALHKRSD